MGAVGIPARAAAGLLAVAAVVVAAACSGSDKQEPSASPAGSTAEGRPPAGATGHRSEGRTIAFVRDQGPNYAIFVMSESGSGAHRLTEAGATFSSPMRRFYQEAPDWSRDGKQIAFASNRTGNFAIYVMRADGSGTRRLTTGRWNDYEPSWSPDGKRIAFSRERGQLYVMNADGSGVRALTRASAARDDEPAWSPDGRRIAFVRKKVGAASIYTVRPDGTELRRVTRPAAIESSPAWSPDGRKIAYSRSSGGAFNILVVNADGTGERKLTRGPGADFNPAWSPDGQSIAFSRNATIYVMRSDGSDLRRLTSEIDDNPVWRP